MQIVDRGALTIGPLTVGKLKVSSMGKSSRAQTTSFNSGLFGRSLLLIRLQDSCGMNNGFKGLTCCVYSDFRALYTMCV